MVSDELILVGQIALALLGLSCGSLAAALFWRNYVQRPRRVPSNFPVTVIDTSSLQPRLEEVRADFLTAVHTLPHSRAHPRTLLELARQAVLKLAYFQSASSRRREEADSVS